MGVKNLAVMIKTLNLVTGIGLVVLSVLSIIDIKEWFTFRFFLIPCPFFVAFFGICIIGAEMKVKAILKRLSFLKTLGGRGVFNVFLSSLVFWFFNKSSDLLAWVSALILFIIGVIYIVFECGWGKQLREEFEKEDSKNEESSKPGRQNLI